jgi:hypothetical protein
MITETKLKRDPKPGPVTLIQEGTGTDRKPRLLAPISLAVYQLHEPQSDQTFTERRELIKGGLRDEKKSGEPPYLERIHQAECSRCGFVQKGGVTNKGKSSNGRTILVARNNRMLCEICWTSAGYAWSSFDPDKPGPMFKFCDGP